MKDPEIRFLGDLQRLDLKPGDRFVLTVDEHLSAAALENLRNAWDALNVGSRLIVLDKGMKLGVLSAESKDPA